MTTLLELANKYPSVIGGSIKVTTATLDAVESALGVRLPLIVRQFLTEYGYGPCMAIPNIEGSIADTKRFRSAGLPHRYVVIEDLNDAGVVLLDSQTHEGAVLWADWHVIEKLPDCEAKGADRYDTFAQWVEARILEEIEFDEGSG